MKTNVRFIIAFLCSALALPTIIACNAGTTIPAPADSVAPREEHNKALVVQYFQEILDGKQYSRMPDVFTPDVVMHRPEGTLTNRAIIQAGFAAAFAPHTVKTTIHEMVASGDYVAVRLSHRMTFSTAQAFWRSRLGVYDVRGKSIEWEAMAMFRFEDGRIAEEWVSTDELGQLLQIGTLEFSVTN